MSRGAATLSLLIVRHPRCLPGFYDVVLQWAMSHLPELMPRVDVRMLPARLARSDAAR